MGFDQVLKNFQWLKKCQRGTNSFRVFQIFSRSQYKFYEITNPFLTILSVKLIKKKLTENAEEKCSSETND